VKQSPDQKRFRRRDCIVPDKFSLIELLSGWSMKIIGQFQVQNTTVSQLPNSLIFCHLQGNVYLIHNINKIRNIKHNTIRKGPLIVSNEVFDRSLEILFHPIRKMKNVRDWLTIPSIVPEINTATISDNPNCILRNTIIIILHTTPKGGKYMMLNLSATSKDSTSE